MITSPAVFWMLTILGLCIWMVVRPGSNDPAKIILLILLFAFEPLSIAVLDAENRAFPLKFDYYLYTIDKALGPSAFSVARLLTDWQRDLLLALYKSLSAAMIAWYAVNLKRRDGRPRTLLLAYVATFVAGPCLYLILPACGPRHAFGSAFPAGNPAVAPVPVLLGYWPNAIPSLHVSTALTFVFFSGKSRFLRFLAWAYLAGTILATLAFEHYTIDLVAAVPFACFATHLAEARFRPALQDLVIVIAWLLALRFGTPVLAAQPVILRLLAIATVGFSWVRIAKSPGKVPEAGISLTSNQACSAH